MSRLPTQAWNIIKRKFHHIYLWTRLFPSAKIILQMTHSDWSNLVTHTAWSSRFLSFSATCKVRFKLFRVPKSEWKKYPLKCNLPWNIADDIIDSNREGQSSINLENCNRISKLFFDTKRSLIPKLKDKVKWKLLLFRTSAITELSIKMLPKWPAQLTPFLKGNFNSFMLFPDFLQTQFHDAVYKMFPSEPNLP